MVEKERSWLKKAAVFLTASFVILVLYFYFYVDMPMMLNTLKGTNVLIFLSAVAVSLFDVFFFTVAWQMFLSALSAKVRFRKLFTFVWASIFIDLIVPAEAISGEVSRVYMLSKEAGFDAGKAVASVVVQRIVSMAVTLVSIVVSITAIAFMNYQISPLVYYFTLLVVILTIAIIVLIMMFCFREEWTRKLIDSILNLVDRVTGKRWSKQVDEWRTILSKVQVAFHNGIATFRAEPKRLVLPVFFSSLGWVCSIFVSYLVFISLGSFDVPFAVVVFVYTLTLGLKSVPIGVPAEFVVPIMAMTVFYGIFGVSVAVGAAVAILVNIITAWLRIVIGFVAIQWVGIKVLKSVQK